LPARDADAGHPHVPAPGRLVSRRNTKPASPEAGFLLVRRSRRFLPALENPAILGRGIEDPSLREMFRRLRVEDAALGFRRERAAQADRARDAGVRLREGSQVARSPRLHAVAYPADPLA